MADNFRNEFEKHEEELRKFDPFAHAVTVIQEQHRMGHDGFMFHSSGKVTGMIDANVDDFLLAVPAATFPHLQRIRFTFGAGDIDLQSYEGTTTSADGAAQSVLNTNRNSANTPDTVLTIGPTVSTPGTLVHTAWAAPTATGTGLSAEGAGAVEAGEEWVLTPSTKYLFRITNNSGATIDYRWEFLWYEVGYDD
jgi:hypothetical protein